MKSNQMNNEETKARYLTNDKKRYYLASVDENIQMLINSQKEELTRVLIELKSEYDTLTRETRTKREEEDRLKHKIIILEQMEKKAKKKMEEASNANESMKSAIELKKKKKEEELYLKKTLSSQITKMNTDTLLIKKEILQVENESRKLDKIIQKQKLNQNELKEKYNGVYSNITHQNDKNHFDNNEQSLQIQYYNTIIEHKSMFIQSADERKERQIKIAQEAKNDSQDQQEELRRKQYELLMLYNKYLRFKMDDQLANTATMEQTYEEIRNICGTDNLDTIVELMLSKDKHYNYSASMVSEEEALKNELLKEISELKCQYIKLKTELPVNESEKEKSVSTVDISMIEAEEKKMIEKEMKLTEELVKLEEKARNVDLIFYKIVENVHLLCNEKAYLDTLATEELEQQMKKEGKDVNMTTAALETNAVDNEGPDHTLALGDDVKEDNENETIQQQTQPQDQQPQPQEQQTQPQDQQTQPQDQQTQPQDQQTQQPKETIVKEEPKTEAIEEPKAEASPELKEKIISQEDEEAITLPPEYDQIVNNLNTFLKNTLRKFDMLFLCHSRQEFLKIMQEKGKETHPRPQEQQNQGNQLSQTRKVVRNSTRKRSLNRENSLRQSKTNFKLMTTEPSSNPIYKGELVYEGDEPMQDAEKLVFRRFIEEQKRNREEYIRYGPKKL